MLGELPGQDPISVVEFHALAEAGHVVIDLRDHLAFGGGHIPDALGIGADGSLSTWAAWVVPYDRPILLVAETPFAVDPDELLLNMSGDKKADRSGLKLILIRALGEAVVTRAPAEETLRAVLAEQLA